jgi:hypothetical protein
MDAIKNELSAEEQFLESVIKAEGFWKKYKKIILALLGAVLLVIAYKLIVGYMHQRSIEASNRAYATLLSNPNDKEALKILKSENPKLYDLFLFQKGVKKDSADELIKLKGSISDPVLQDLLTYQSSSLKSSGLGSYAIKEGAILKDLANYEEAYLLLKSKKIKEAREKLKQIPQNSPLYGLAQNLKNFNGE